MSLWISGVTNSAAIASGLTRYHGFNAFGNWLITTETQIQARCRASYTVRNLLISVQSTTGTHTARDRKNAANGGLSVSITSSGLKEDTANSTSLASGDLFNLQVVVSGGHSDTLTLSGPNSIHLDDGDASGPIWGGTTPAASYNSTSALYASLLCSPINPVTTESTAQFTVRCTTTLSRFRLFIVSNANANATTWRTRVNTANGGQSMSLSGSATGEIEDASGTDSIVPGDLLCFSRDSSASANNTTTTIVQVRSSAAVLPTPRYSSAATLNAGGTNYFSLCGSITGATESATALKTRVVDTFRNMIIKVVTNTLSQASTADFRANSASPGSGPSISVSAGATGTLEDTANTYTSTTTDTINSRYSSGGGSGSATFTYLGFQQGNPQAAATGRRWAIGADIVGQLHRLDGLW